MAALTLLHGWGLHGGIWDALRAALPELAMHTPDLPGYGGSARVSPYTAEALADAIAPTLPDAGLLLGWSMGGMVALALAARHPQKVRALVLVATTPSYVNRTGWDKGLTPELLAGFAQGVQNDYRATLLRFLSLQARGGDAAREVIGRLRETVFARGEPDAAVLAEGLELLRAVDLRDVAGQVQAPTLVVHGGYDGLCLPQAGQWLAATLPNARLALQPKAAHAPFLSHPDWFVDELKGFLREHA
ncbi:carboxylesterase BioH (pimeloyl-CoA synthesis) [Sulfuritortus calidifontis]|uniref:Pimeloyl-[acyl-carrier protein] methyl ester esterase n=1 Tax=Sulfuritortus calidifontis TaxID=1914471 RepID=A0A4R3JY54_9PROT|nr:pimeloyl-ACP methyl ester esterase BioH [Sulfuritortus calidifontis]TCS73394.1 carboxylesterase BioH (pimeloyl-CoA synthesis) [Sulfuritortus calidifontis]